MIKRLKTYTADPETATSDEGNPGLNISSGADPLPAAGFMKGFL
jgi:hypothetical protein